MASALIDRAMLVKMVATQLETLVGVTVRHLREDDPDVNSWLRVRSLKLKRNQRQRQGAGGPDEPDHGRFTLVIQAVAGPGATSAWALAQIAQAAVLGLHEQTLTDSGSGHQMDFQTVDESADPEFLDPERAMESVLVTFEGEAFRSATAGTTAI